jgi:hypothetical protein
VAEIITVTDLPVALQTAELIDIMVAGANAKASRIAPCLASTDPLPTEDQLAEAQLVLIGAVKRWSEAGSGALQQQTAGPFSQALDTRQRTGFNLWPSEIEQLQSICASEKSGAFSIDTAPTGCVHLPWCSLMFGAVYCSCGVDIAGTPIFELN